MYLTYHKKHPPKKKTATIFLPTCQSMKLRGRFVLRPGARKRWIFFPAVLSNWSISPRGSKSKKCLKITTWNIMHPSDYLTQHPPHLYPHLSSNSSDSPSDSIPCVKDLGLSSKTAWGPKKSMETSLRLKKKHQKNIILLGKEKSQTISGRKKIHPRDPWSLLMAFIFWLLGEVKLRGSTSKPGWQQLPTSFTWFQVWCYCWWFTNPAITSWGW